MIPTSRHHAEWLSLLEISGPFVSLPVLLRAFPQGLDTVDADKVRTLRLAYEEWRDSVAGRRPDLALHTLWVRFVLENLLELPRKVILEGQAIPAGLKATIAEQGETLRPDLVIANPPGDASAGKPRVLVHVYPPGQDLDRPVHGQRWKASPATRMMELLHATEVRLGLVTNGERWMLVDAPRGETTGFVSWYAEYWLEEPITFRAFRSLLGVGRLFGVAEADTLEMLLAESAKDQQEVTNQLGYQVRRAVGVLVQALDRADQDRGRQLLAGLGEAQLYEAALTFMMRLVFLFSAEERGLLLLGDPLYDQFYAVSTLRAQLREAADQHGEEVLALRFDAWSRLLATFRAVHGGVQHENLRLPAYGGSLFDPDRFPFLEGRPARAARLGHAARLSPPSPPHWGEGGRGDEGGPSWRDVLADPLPINNRVVLHLLEALQILRVKVPGGGPAEPRRLSFRALDIEQIGHVYEGLLDHTAVRAAEPVLGLAGMKDKEPEVALGELERRRSDAPKAGQKSEVFVAYLREITGRSESALRRSLEANLPHAPTSILPYAGLRVACANDDALYHRMLPFAGLLREDDFGLPVVITAGSVYVTAGTDRRSSGTHYTPRILTEPIVQHTLEPLVYTGPAEGLPREQWTLKAAADLLALKVCDMAMGCGTFLVQTCRYLAERLVEAWEKAEGRQQEAGGRRHAERAESSLPTADRRLPTVRITPEGKLSTGDPNELLIPIDPDERLAFARRIVADRCLYGVDKNPLAVEMAKLSLWLITLDRNRPFTFLDHALKCGDSLVGADENMFLRWAHGVKDTAATLFDETLRQQLETARAKRRELESFEVREVRDAERKAALLAEAEAAMARVKLGCDLLIGTRLLGLKPRQVDARLNMLLMEYMAKEQPESAEAREALDAARKVRAFHWPFEFPEVFERGGFSAYVGNPPFLGGRYISGQMGDDYLAILKELLAKGAKGNADLIAYFYLRANDLLHTTGTAGFIGTKTVGEGDTHDVGLSQIAKRSTLYATTSARHWPGSAKVVFVSVHWIRGSWQGVRRIDGTEVETISSRLAPLLNAGPKRLMQSIQPYQGSYIHGMGFVLSVEGAEGILRQDPGSRPVILPCLSAEDFNSSPVQAASRFAIYFGELGEDRAKQFRGAWQHVVRNVKAEREQLSDKALSTYWWKYKRPTKPLYDAIWPLSHVLVCPVVTKHLSFAWITSRIVLLNRMYAFIGAKPEHFAVLQSSIYTMWAWQWSGRLKKDLQFAPTDCFDNCPFPVTNGHLASLGDHYHEARHQVMLSRQAGLTATYNRFHNSDERGADIARLRELHVEMDKAVAAAYGWDDVDLGHGFHETLQGTRFTLSEAARREVLARLLRLNHERYEEEVRAGMHEKKNAGGKGSKGAARKKKGEGGEQLGML